MRCRTLVCFWLSWGGGLKFFLVSIVLVIYNKTIHIYQSLALSLQTISVSLAHTNTEGLPGNQGTYSVICTSMKRRMKMRKAGMMEAKMTHTGSCSLIPMGLMNQPRLLGCVGTRSSWTFSFCTRISAVWIPQHGQNNNNNNLKNTTCDVLQAVRQF